MIEAVVRAGEDVIIHTQYEGTDLAAAEKVVKLLEIYVIREQLNLKEEITIKTRIVNTIGTTHEIKLEKYKQYTYDSIR